MKKEILYKYFSMSRTIRFGSSDFVSLTETAYVELLSSFDFKS